MKVKLIVTTVLLLLVLVFIFQNAATVEIRLILWEFSISRSLLILMTFAIGLIVGWFLRAMYRISRSGQ